MVPWWWCCESVCDWWTLANDTFSSSQTPDARLRAAIATPPKFRSPGLHLELLRDPSFKTRVHFYLWPFLVLAHVPLQTFSISIVAKFPNPNSPGVPGSGHNWVLGAVAYIACWILWIFGVFLGYEVLYSYYRRWRFRRPLILPIYMSSPAFNFVALSSYDHFCFLQHIRSSAFPTLTRRGPSFGRGLAARCARRNVLFLCAKPSDIVTLLPRAGLGLAFALVLQY
ncbi:hypothetical protein BGY98DRAFT_462221 [Russula aff. rugulosa BPL654]|nr:hypothetical protein BGY98DRAFT_462221 [Russula aff. rugulosa BPL654]